MSAANESFERRTAALGIGYRLRDLVSWPEKTDKSHVELFEKVAGLPLKKIADLDALEQATLGLCIFSAAVVNGLPKEELTDEIDLLGMQYKLRMTEALLACFDEAQEWFEALQARRGSAHIIKGAVEGVVDRKRAMPKSQIQKMAAKAIATGQTLMWFSRNTQEADFEREVGFKERIDAGDDFANENSFLGEPVDPEMLDLAAAWYTDYEVPEQPETDDRLFETQLFSTEPSPIPEDQI